MILQTFEITILPMPYILKSVIYIYNIVSTCLSGRNLSSRVALSTSTYLTSCFFLKLTTSYTIKHEVLWRPPCIIGPTVYRFYLYLAEASWLARDWLWDCYGIRWDNGLWHHGMDALPPHLPLYGHSKYKIHMATNKGHLGLMAFWCLLVSKKPQNIAMVWQEWL